MHYLVTVRMGVGPSLMGTEPGITLRTALPDRKRICGIVKSATESGIPLWY